MPLPSTNSSLTNSSLTLSDLFRSVTTQWRLFIGVVIVCVALGVAVGIAYPKTYAATSTLTVEPLDVTADSETVNMDTERVVASSTSVLTRATVALPRFTVSQLASALTVSVPKGSQVLEFTLTMPKPADAADAANAIAAAYSSLRVETAASSVEAASTTLTQRISDLESIRASQGEQSKAAKAAAIQIEALQDSLATLNSATFNPGTLVSTAVEPTSATKPSLTVFGVGGLAFGVILGSLLALARARRVEARAAAAAAAAASTAAASASALPKDDEPQPEAPVDKPADETSPDEKYYWDDDSDGTSEADRPDAGTDHTAADGADTDDADTDSADTDDAGTDDADTDGDGTDEAGKIRAGAADGKR